MRWQMRPNISRVVQLVGHLFFRGLEEPKMPSHRQILNHRGSDLFLALTSHRQTRGRKVLDCICWKKHLLGEKALLPRQLRDEIALILVWLHLMWLLSDPKEQ